MKPTVSLTRMRGSVSGMQRAHGGVERREELVGDEHLAPRERAHQRRLAGVRVADSATRASPRRPGAVRAASCARRRIATSSSCSSAMRSRILRRSSSTAPSPAPLPPTPPRCRPCAADCRLAQARREVAQARDLDLRARFARARVAMEDLQDHHRAIQHLAAGRLLEVARLRRRYLVIDQHELGAPGFRAGRGLPCFTVLRLAVVGDASFARFAASVAPLAIVRSHPLAFTKRRISPRFPMPRSAAESNLSRFCMNVPTTWKPTIFASWRSSSNNTQALRHLPPAAVRQRRQHAAG